MEQVVVEAQPRSGRGKNAARRLRRAGLVPAVAYGGKKEPVAVSVDPRAIERILHSEAGRNAVLALQIKGYGSTPAMIKDWQYEPVRGSLLHLDFLRIAMDVRLKVKVPVLPQGEPVGVKQQAGILEFVNREVEVECLPGDIPDHLTIDVSELKIGESFRVGDLKMDRRYQVLTDSEQVLAHVIAPKVHEEEKPAEELAEVTEPEVIRKGKVEEAEAEAEAPAEKPARQRPEAGGPEKSEKK